MRAAKPLAMACASPAARWWSWWARYRLPHLVRKRIYVTDLDSIGWCLYRHRHGGNEEVRVLALLEVLPASGSLEARRSSLLALRTLAEMAGVPAFIVEVDYRRATFRVRTMWGLHVLVGPTDEVAFARWLEDLASMRRPGPE